jgi:hypothetical protein
MVLHIPALTCLSGKLPPTSVGSRRLPYEIHVKSIGSALANVQSEYNEIGQGLVGMFQS